MGLWETQLSLLVTLFAKLTVKKAHVHLLRKEVVYIFDIAERNPSAQKLDAFTSLKSRPF